jgi:flagellar biosynthesis/type III secretory pathway M-ring protein FliF/YscJ
VVTVENMTFSNTGENDLAPTLGERVQKMVNDNVNALKYASLLLLFVLTWSLNFRPMQKQIVSVVRELGTGNQGSIAVAELASSVELPGDDFDNLLEADSNTVGLKRRLADMVQAEPATMTRTLQTWLQESEG